MSEHIILQTVRVDGPGRKSADITFKPGLNAVVGASDTGKSYIFQTLDYLLGGGSEPKQNPNSEGYNRAWLQLLGRNAKTMSIERLFGEDMVNAYETKIEQAIPGLVKSRIRAFHQTGSVETLSHLLLEQIGLADRQVRRNLQNAKNAVSFRYLAHLTMVDEQRIITDGSPALTGQHTAVTAEQGVLSLLITGNDDSALTPVKVDKKLRDTALDAEINLLQRLIDEKGAKLRAVSPNPEDVQPTLDKLTESIRLGTTFVSATKERIAAIEVERQMIWTRIEEVRSRRLVLREQLKRLALLLEYYTSDASRLEAVIEAGAEFERLPTGECAVCGCDRQCSVPEGVTETLHAFQTACRAELAKIAALSADLKNTVLDYHNEESSLALEEQRLSVQRVQIETDLEGQLKPSHDDAETSLVDFIRLKGDFSRAKDLKDEIAGLQEDLMKAETQKKVKVPRLKTTARIDTRMAQDLCQIVSNVLKAWNYPLNGTVTFDPTKFDLVIGNQHRGSMGKGYRAITHAAFTISLMRFCRQRGLPHTGFVVLDSPLNPFRGEVTVAGPDGAINGEMKDAFYRDLAADKSGNQYIILENIEPPADLLSTINYVQFTRNEAVGRYGFFPVG